MLRHNQRMNAPSLGYTLRLGPPSPKGTCSPWWFTGGLLLAMLALGFLEWQQPYYFVQDDNHRQYMPVMLYALDSFYQTGTLPLWEPYSGMGQSLINGAYMLYYPPMHLCYLLSRLLGDTALTFELFALLHLYAAYAIYYAAMRRMNASAMLSACAAFCFALAGYHLIQGRSWLPVAALPAYLAAMIYLLTYAVAGEKLTRRWGVLFTLTVTLLFYLSHAQFWLYAMITFAMAYGWTLLAHGKTGLRSMPVVLTSLLASLALIAPMFMLQWMELRDIPPVEDWSERGVQHHWLSLIMPSADRWSARLFAGGIFTIAAVLLLVLSIGGMLRYPKRPPAPAAYLIPAFFCLFMLSGDQGFFWPLIKHWPIIHHFRDVEKTLPYLHAFAIAGGVWIMAQWASVSKRLHMVVHVLAVIAVMASCYNISRCFLVWSPLSDRPYPPLSTALTDVKQTQHDGSLPFRIVSVGPGYNGAPGFVQQLSSNYATYYRIFSATRYPMRVTSTPARLSLLEQTQKNPAAFMQRYGIGWAVNGMWPPSHDDFRPDYATASLMSAAQNPELLTDLVPVADHIDLLTLDTDTTTPLAGWRPLDKTDWKPAALPFDAIPNGLRITLPPFVRDRGGDKAVIANFLYHPWFKAYAEPQHAPLSLEEDKAHRMLVVLSDKAEAVELRFEPPWQLGWLYAMGLALLALMTHLLTERWVRLASK